MTLPEMIAGLQELLERKAELEEQTKKNNLDIETAKALIAEQMIDDDVTEVTHNGYSFKLTPKTSYSKKSEADLAEAGLVFFDVLREEGLGDIIVETVNARMLQATMSAYVEEHGELSEELSKVIRVYEFNDIVRRKKTERKGAKSNVR